MKEQKKHTLLHIPFIGLEYSGKSTILHQLRADHAGQNGAFRSLFTFKKDDHKFTIVLRFSSLQDEFRNFPADLLVKKSDSMFRKHVGNVEVFIPSMCVLVNREDGTLRPEYVTLPLANSKNFPELQTVLLFLNVSPEFLLRAAPQVYRYTKIAEKAVIEFEELKKELAKSYHFEEIDGNRPLTKLDSIVSDLENLIVKIKRQHKEA